MLMNMKDLLAVANENNFAIPAFNIGTGQILKAVIDCCEEKKAPVILAIHPCELEFQGDSIAAACVAAAHASKIPMAINLDHGSSLVEIQRAIRTGFTSVMIDASSKSLEENIEITKQVVAIAHPLNISVEAEIGTIGTTGTGAEAGTDEIIFTDPKVAKEFVEKTGIDALAIAIGTAHGIYPKGKKPKLRLDLLSDIKSMIDIPLVLHGGSSNSDDEIAEAVRRGINKINISSDVKSAFYTACRHTMNELPNKYEPFDVYVDGIKAMKEVINFKIDLFDDADKVKHYRL